MLRSFQFKKAVHVQAATGSPLCTCEVPQPSRNRHQRGLTVREAANCASTAADLAHDPPQRIIGVDASPVLLCSSYSSTYLQRSPHVFSGFVKHHALELLHDCLCFF